jgi:hypothetical protein
MVSSLSFSDLEFERAPREFQSTRGVPQIAWTPVGMPHIPQRMIKSVFYLYRTKEDAKAGQNPGGTGFLVAFQYSRLDYRVRGGQYYAVTNWHVACRDGFSIIRLNTIDGGTDIVELDSAEWEFLPSKYDVAIAPVTIDDKIHEISFVSTLLFADPPKHDAHGMRRFYGDKIGVGEDVFMIGLFFDHSGVTTNVPSARFGNISMLPNPNATIEQPTKYKGESYVVDMHSRSGFSGSPVFVYRTFGSDLTESEEPFDSIEMDFDTLELEPSRLSTGSPSWARQVVSGRVRGAHGRLKPSRHLLKLLGIHWGQFPEEWQLLDKNRLAESKEPFIVDGAYVKGLSGMTCVIPAWHILEVLNMPALKNRRDAEEAILPSEPTRPIGESASAAGAGDENPSHKEDFTSLLNAAAKKKP